MSRKPVAGSSKAVAPKSKTAAPAARVDETLLDGIDAQRVRRVAALAEELGLVELEVQHGESRIRVRRGGDGPTTAPLVAAAMPMRSESAAVAPAAAPSLPAGSTLLRAPMAGTFYRAPAPGQPVFVDAGSTVQPESVVCIIESMKMMNRIEAERSGRIASVLVANGARIQIGQPLFALVE